MLAVCEIIQADAARDVLSEKLQTILIRRTGETLLRDVLPCRREFIVALSMQGTQKEQYLEVANSLLRGARTGTTSLVDSPSHEGIFSRQFLQSLSSPF